MSPESAGFRHFHDQLQTLKERLLEMSARAEELIDLAVDSLLTRDKEKADAVISGDRELDMMELECEQIAVSLLALQQPMGRDLRFLISAVKITSDLERVGDHAVNIAQSALRLIALHVEITPTPEIEDMARRARKMLAEALDAFIRADGVLGREVCKADDAVDALHDSVFRILLTHMMADARTINPSLELLLVSRNLERVADLATNIGEDAVFLAEGKQIKHHFEDLGRDRPAVPQPTGEVALPAFSRSPDAARSPRAEQDVRLAAIDIGSNSIRQIVADVSPSGSIRVVDEMKAAPRLGAGIRESGLLNETSMRHALEALTRMATLARQLGASRVEAVATSAVRDATNGLTFLELVRSETGLKVKVLRGEEEARLSFRSALAHFELGVGRAVVMDIGGGSLELALSADGLLERLISLPFGAIRLTEEFLGPRTRRKSVRRLRAAIRDDIRKALPVRDWRGAQVIGSGGTFTNLAGIYLMRQGVQTARTTHGTRLPREELEHILDMLQDMSPDQRAAVPGLNPARADIIVAGFAVAAEVLARLESREVIVSAYGIREGLLLETARVVPTFSDRGEARERSVREFAERCHYEEPHARHVQRLALQLFDAIGPRIGLSATDRQVLADAALLHDVGYHINYEKHHKHSYHLIVHADMLGMSPEEQVAIANVARYHRGAPPKRKHPNYGILDRGLRRRIRKLAAILRVADGFDRGHIGAVERVKVRWLDRALRLTAVANRRAQSLRLDLWGASRKSALLSRVTHIPIEVVAPDGTVVTPQDADEQAD